jgi:hypothetical protein
MTILEHGGIHVRKGAWTLWNLHGGKPLFVISCPLCGFVARLDHEVAADGLVSPSVQCPLTGCDFHDTVKLKDYVEGAP